MRIKKFQYHRARTVQDAVSLMGKLEGATRYVAGGTDVIASMKQGRLHPEALISLNGVEELKGIAHPGGLNIGSMTLLREVERDPGVNRNYPALAQAVCVLANPQVRNVATIGGNICNAAPSAECAPPLLILEASLLLEGPGGVRDVPIEDFFTGPGETLLEPFEVLREIRIPRQAANTGMAFLKIGRVSQDLAVVNAAALLVVKNGKCRECRLAVGAVAPTPLRLKKAEKILVGKEIGEDLLDEVGKLVESEVRPITDVRSTEVYRRSMSGVLVKRAIREAFRDVGKARSMSATTGEPHTAEYRNKHTLPVDSKSSAPASPFRKEIRFSLNGHEVSVETASHKMLLEIIREQFQLKGAKEGCGQGECGACTVVVNGVGVDACLYPAFEIEGKSVTTIEGLIGEGNRLHPLQQSFVENGGVQCGFCTPGMIMSAKAFLDEKGDADDDAIRRAISGNLCRCTGYVQIVESIKKVLLV